MSGAGNRVLLSVAPVAAADTHVDPERIAADVIACHREGAGMVHLHARDRGGRLTPDTAVFEETVERIRAGCGIVIQASTGGVSEMTIEERCAPLGSPGVECASLNVGSVNLGRAVYRNAPEDVEYCVERIVGAGIVPEVEVFELGMIHTAAGLAERFSIPAPLLLSIVLGHEGAAPATVEALAALRGFVPPGVLWGVTHYGRRDDRLIAAAVAMGAVTVRVGFEDSPILEGGKAAPDNASLVRRFAGLLRVLGKKPMTPGEARALLGIPAPK